MRSRAAENHKLDKSSGLEVLLVVKTYRKISKIALNSLDFNKKWMTLLHKSESDLTHSQEFACEKLIESGIPLQICRSKIKYIRPPEMLKFP